MTREELKEQIDELMKEYTDEKIDGATYAQKMMELTTSAQNENDDDEYPGLKSITSPLYLKLQFC